MARVAGTVVEVRDGRAWIECHAEAAACGACASGRGCAWQAGVCGRRFLASATLDDRPLEAGDTLVLETDESRLLQAALRLYLPPLLGVVAGPLLVRWAGLEAGVVPLLAAAAGLLAGVLLARQLTRQAPGIVLHRS